MRDNTPTELTSREPGGLAGREGHSGGHGEHALFCLSRPWVQRDKGHALWAGVFQPRLEPASVRLQGPWSSRGPADRQPMSTPTVCSPSRFPQ